MKKLSLFIFFICLWPAAAWAQGRTYLIQGDAHLECARALVEAALAAAGFEAKFRPAPAGNEYRNVRQISTGATAVDMMPPSTQRLRLLHQGKLRMIPVPLDRGILSYRLNILLGSRRDILADVRTAADLAAFTLGQNEGWADADIYRQAGIPVKDVRVWADGEFAAEMEAGFIDLFPLGLEEAVDIFLPHFRAKYPQLAADPHLLVRYPWYRFVWVAVGPETDGLYEALQRGFDIIARNGVFLKTWLAHRHEPAARLFRGRHVIDIPNYMYGEAIVPEKYRRLIFRPQR